MTKRNTRKYCEFEKQTPASLRGGQLIKVQIRQVLNRVFFVSLGHYNSFLYQQLSTQNQWDELVENLVHFSVVYGP